MYYNPNIPLETALEMFDDPHIRFEIIEDYFQAIVSAAVEHLIESSEEHIVRGEN